MRETVRVDLGARSYDIVIGDEILRDAGRLVAATGAYGAAVIVTDANVAALYLDRVASSLADAGIGHQTIVLPPGESTKSFPQLESLLDKVLGLDIDRSTVLIALGGGVIGDLVGFAAAVALRGIPFVQIPTTLLAQVDSSVGGKTGINTGHGKNLIGAFYQPRLVIADVASLDTLSERERRSGYAEVVKYAAIDSPAFFTWLDQDGIRLLGGDRSAAATAVRFSCERKAAIVAADERESGIRALLNLGHTFGHALEAEAGYSTALTHGEAVAIGMVLAFDLSVRLGLCDLDHADRLRRHLDRAGLPTQPRQAGPGGRDAAAILARMGKDKKVEGGRLNLILARGIGSAFIARDVDRAAVASLLQDAVAA